MATFLMDCICGDGPSKGRFARYFIPQMLQPFFASLFQSPPVLHLFPIAWSKNPRWTRGGPQPGAFSRSLIDFLGVTLRLPLHGEGNSASSRARSLFLRWGATGGLSSIQLQESRSPAQPQLLPR